MIPSSRNTVRGSSANHRAREKTSFRQNQSHHQGHHRLRHQLRHQLQQKNNRIDPDEKRSSSSLIQSNSIQNQFTVLSNQKDAFVRERNLAQTALEQIQKNHKSIKAEHDSLIESSRQAKERLGQGKEKLAMLKEQEARILQLTENEFRAIENCTNHSKMLDQKKDEASKKYTAEMDPLNLELATLLEGRFNSKIERCISLGSIQAVVLPEIQRATKDQDRPQLLNEKENLFRSIESLKEATKRQERLVTRCRQLSDTTLLHQKGSGCANSRFHAFDRSLARSSTDELAAETNKGSSMHIDLFYGPSNEE